MGGGNPAQCHRLDHYTDESDVRVAQHAFASVVQATGENVILMQVVLGMTSPAACKLKAFSTDLVHFVLKVRVRNSSGSNGHCLRANSVSQEEDGNISRYNSNDILLVDAIASPGTQAIGAECSHGQAGEHN